MSLKFIFDAKNREYSPLVDCFLNVFDLAPKILRHILPVIHVPYTEVTHYVAPAEVETLVEANVQTMIRWAPLAVDLTRVKDSPLKLERLVVNTRRGGDRRFLIELESQRRPGLQVNISIVRKVIGPQAHSRRKKRGQVG